MTDVVVACIGGVSIVVVALIEKVRRDNKKDHGIVHDKLESLLGNQQTIKQDVADVKQDVRNVNKRLDDHIDRSV